MSKNASRIVDKTEVAIDSMDSSIERLRATIDSLFITWGPEGPHEDDEAARDDIRVGVVRNLAKEIRPIH